MKFVEDNLQKNEGKRRIYLEEFTSLDKCLELAQDRLMYAFQIAGVPLVLKFMKSNQIPLSLDLLAFKADLNSSIEQAVFVEFIPDAPNMSLYRQHAAIPHSPIQMCSHHGQYLFTCQTGQALVARDFSRVALWAPFEQSIRPDFDGYPWLQLILWGRLSLIGGCYLHGAIGVIDGVYVLFLGDSGAGKSTLSGLLVEQGFTSLTEENPFLTWKDEQPCVHATPWRGMRGPTAPISGSLHSIYFLRHAHSNQIQKLDMADAGIRLINNSRMFNWLPHTIPGAVELLDRTLKAIPVYDFGFVPGADAVSAIRGML